MNSIQLDAICNFEKGKIGLAKAVPGIYPLVTTGSERRTCDSFQFDTRAVCIPLVSSTGHGHASLKNVHYQEGKFALGSILVALTAKDENQLNIQYLHLYLSELKDQILVPLMSGAANVSLSVSKIQKIKIPLPNIVQQREIVRKFNSIKLEDVELRLELASQLVMLKKLRQRILQEAIEGKLTIKWRMQNPNVEPASKLLECISAKKNDLIKNKKLKKGEKQESNKLGNLLFEVPESWELPDLDDITQFITDGTHQTPKYTKHGRAFLSAQNVKPFLFMPENHKFISDDDYKSYIKNKTPEKGDLLVGRVGSKGETALIDRDIEFAFYVSLCLIKTFKYETSPKFLEIVMNSPYGNAYASGNMSSLGASAGNFNLGHIRSFPIPFPPITEQIAIVSKVEILFDQCAKIEAQIVNNQTHAIQLIQAVLKEAFTHEIQISELADA